MQGYPRFYISPAGPHLGIAIQGDGKKGKREMALPVGTEKASHKLIYYSSQLICLHTRTHLSPKFTLFKSAFNCIERRSMGTKQDVRAN